MKSRNGLKWEVIKNENEDLMFSARYGHTVNILDETMYLIGGKGIHNINNIPIYKYYNDIWSSIDGYNWNLVNFFNKFSPRLLHSTII